jgi:hypothetical protein
MLSFIALAAHVVRAHASNMTVVGNFTANAGEDQFRSAVTDGTYAYFGTNTNPGVVVKIDLSTMTRVGSVTANAAEELVPVRCDGLDARLLRHRHHPGHGGEG